MSMRNYMTYKCFDCGERSVQKSLNAIPVHSCPRCRSTDIGVKRICNITGPEYPTLCAFTDSADVIGALCVMLFAFVGSVMIWAAMM